jgi:hypothetical protein
MKPKKPLLFTFGLAVAIGLASVATLPLVAEDREWHQLRGTYFSTGENLCLVSPSGFNSNLTPISPPTDGNPPAYVQSSSVQGL